jgi:hypothetical protein
VDDKSEEDAGEREPRHIEMDLGARALDLADALIPALLWLRQEKRVPGDDDVFAFVLDLRWLRALAFDKVVPSKCQETDLIRTVCGADDIPEDRIAPLQNYLRSLPGMAAVATLESTFTNAAIREHAFVANYLVATPLMGPEDGSGSLH